MTTLAGVTGQADVVADMSVDCDVVVVGSGAGGATVAAELAAAGIDVVIIEEGGYHPTESFQAKSMTALRTLYRDGGGGMTIGKPSVLFAEGRCVGGSTVVNGGMSWRTPPHILDRWATQEQIKGLTAKDMAPFFAMAEARLSVGPQDPETIGRDSQLLKAGADARGWRIVPNQRNQLHCAGTNNCNNGCPTGAKRSMLVTSVPQALADGARLFADCRVDRITMTEGRTRAIGVVARFLRPGRPAPPGRPKPPALPGAAAPRSRPAPPAPPGRPEIPGRTATPRPGPKLTVRAKVVIAAGGAIQTPALLARSGLKSGQLGRNLSMHPNAILVAYFDEEVTGWHGVHQAFQVREFMAEGIILTANNLAPPMLAAIMPGHGRELGDLMAGYNHIVTAGPLVEDSGTGRVKAVPGFGPQVIYRLTDRDAARVVRGVRLTAEAMFAAGARRMLLPFDGAPEMRSPDQVRRLLDHRVPKQVMRLFSVHLMGTARMSEDPRRGVTDGHGEFRDVKGLIVADASLFPGPTGLNPMETVIALAARNARHLIDHRSRYGI